jgi:NAD(P)-dependent dehydrogenase (short-subunit alcohol dehydrogenase family)
MKNVIVTGSASGFGLLTVQSLAKKGHTVYATMRNVDTKNVEAAESLKKWGIEHSVDIRLVELDITSDSSVKTAIDQIAADSRGKIDVLINNAGLYMAGLSETVSTAQLEHMFQVNVFGADRLNKAVLPYMHKQNSGLLIQLSSGLARLHLPYLGAYSAAKAAIDTLAEILNYELIKTGIDSVIIQPGVYPATDIFNKQIKPDNPLAEHQYGEFAAKIRGAINRIFTKTPNSPDATEVAELLVQIIDTPREERKLWSVIGSGNPAVASINETTQQLSLNVQNAIGIN